MIIVKSPREIEKIRVSGRIVAETLALIKEAVQPGVSTLELDTIAAKNLKKHGATSPFLGYPNSHNRKKPFPGVVCASVNDEIVHGVPNKRPLKEGDIVTIDCGAKYQGWIADSAWTFAVGNVDAEAQRLLDVTEDALYKTIAAAIIGNRTGDVAWATQSVVEAAGYNVIRDHVSHGVGRNLHEDPQILNYGRPGRGLKLRKGLTIALEPMVLVGDYETMLLPDEWTVASSDGKLTAHFEHTIAITENGPEILTKL